MRIKVKVITEMEMEEEKSEDRTPKMTGIGARFGCVQSQRTIGLANAI